MGIYIWCLIAPMFLVSVKAELYDNVGQSFYETPQFSSPSPEPMQSSQPDLTGMKEIILFLTPDQVNTLQAAGAVVQPYPEYDTHFADLMQQFQQSVEQQNEQQYQTWRSSSEDLNQKDDAEDYHKLLSIQGINDDLIQQTQATEAATEATTEMTSTTPRYKYTKARQQYKEKEYSIPYVPKKPSRPKITDQNYSEYVRFLPSYENENIKMAPYHPLPLFAYQFENDQTKIYIPAKPYFPTSTQTQQDAHYELNRETQQNVFAEAITESQRNVFTQANTKAPQKVFTEAITEAQQNLFTQTNSKTPENVSTEATTEAQQSVFSQANTEIQQNSTEANTETPGNIFTEANTEAPQNVSTEVKTEAQQSSYSQVTEKSTRNEFKSSVTARIQVEKESENPQALLEVPAFTSTEKPATVQTSTRAQDTTEFKETLSSIEGFLPLEQQREPETVASPPFAIQNSYVPNKDKFSLLLAPLYQHHAITETIAREKEELLSGEFNIHNKLQQIKELPQYYDPQEYTTELEKLHSNLRQQNALAEIEAFSKSPSVFINQESGITESYPIEFVQSTKLPLDVKRPAPYRVPLEFLRPFRGEVRKRFPVSGIRNVYIQGDKSFTIQKNNPFTDKNKIPVRIPINRSEEISIIRHIWDH